MAGDDGYRGPPADPSGGDQPHDVLAAEEFAIPAPEAPHAPGDPAGIEEPHDVLAAEEFPIPAPDGAAGDAQGAARRGIAVAIEIVTLAGAVALALALIRRLRAR